MHTCDEFVATKLLKTSEKTPGISIKQSVHENIDKNNQEKFTLLVFFKLHYKLHTIFADLRISLGG